MAFVNQVKLRKIALSIASISAGGFLAALLLCSVCINAQVYCYAESPESAQNRVSAEGIRISCTPLVVENMAYYDGVFYEDGSGREVVGVAAVLLRNCSDATVPFASMVVYTENCRYEFEATMLPPDSTVLIPEMNGALLTEKDIVRCFGWVTVPKDTPPEGITVTAAQHITVANLSSVTVENLLVYYRTYLREEDVYLGGMSFILKAPAMAPGETVTLFPDCYAPGYSRVVWYAAK